ncbi:MAG: hypothetical protein IT359_04705 [Gemmatimonadaceae bacterium]|nr:hypothetical protein [Gemmatimonadaceae bacterium]
MRHTFLTGSVLALLAACGGGEPKLGTSRAAPGAAAESSPADSTTPGPAVTGAAASPQAPVAGSIIEVKMIGDSKGYRFEPARIEAKPGDEVRFVVVSGGPHEVAFDLDRVPEETRMQLVANMPNGANGHSPLLSVPRETWMLSLSGLKPGVYPFVSTPRLAQGMKGELEIK